MVLVVGVAILVDRWLLYIVVVCCSLCDGSCLFLCVAIVVIL